MLKAKTSLTGQRGLCHAQKHTFSTVSRLNSTEYAEFREKLRGPIIHSRNVVIHLTMSELFLETFKAQVDLNQTYTLPSGQVSCSLYSCFVTMLRTYCNSIHCLHSVASVNLIKSMFFGYTGGRALYWMYASSGEH